MLDPKGFFPQTVPYLARSLDVTGRESARKTFRVLMLLSSILRNRSPKSELTNILSLYLHVVNNHFPNGIKARLWRLCLPELQVEPPVDIL